jgi:hypothetical protein
MGSQERYISNTGNREFDLALARKLSKLTDVTGVLPGFSFFADVDGANAMRRSRQLKADGSVLLGRRHFLRKMNDPDHPED